MNQVEISQQNNKNAIGFGPCNKYEILFFYCDDKNVN